MKKEYNIKENSLLSFVGKFLFIAAMAIIVFKFLSSDDQATTITLPSVTIEFDEIAELAVEKYSVSGVANYQNSRQFFGMNVPFTQKHFIVSYIADVKVGLSDVTKITTDIDTFTHTIHVTVPEVEILDVYIDPDNMKTYDESSNALNQISVDDVIEFTNSQLDVARETAINQGVLTIAQDRVEMLVTNHILGILSGTDYENYEIIFEVENNLPNSEEVR